MPSMIKSSAAILLALSLSAFSGCAEAGQSVDVNDKAAIEEVVRSYLLENPEIIREALIVLQEKEERQSITNVAQELRHDDRDFSVGPKDAKVTIVEFFDYNCGYCKRSTDWVLGIIEEYPKDVRVVFKELPILDRGTQTSRKAALAALAAHQQGKYQQMHVALMAASTLQDVNINAMAKNIGLDMDQFENDRKDPKIAQQVEDTLYLASKIPGLTGTPFFVINDKFIASGDTNSVEKMLNEALEEAS